VSSVVLRIVGGLNLAWGAVIVAMLLLSWWSFDWLLTALGVPDTGENRGYLPDLRILMCYGLAAVVITQYALIQVSAIVGTVREGDPFVQDNADRLRRVAKAILVLQILQLALGLIPLGLPEGIEVDGSLSLVPWLAILFLFVIARVFEHGAAMREDLEGTV
jgi:hypothetical protein